MLWALFLLLSSIQALPQSLSQSTNDNTGPVWNSCGNLMRNTLAKTNTFGIVKAVDVYNCWATVPFNSAVGTNLITYWNDTMQFESVLDYLKNPPPGYQKPAVDLLAGLQQIQDKIDAGDYHGQYDFESDLQHVLYSANDAHVGMVGGLLASFKFANPYGITSLSLDGIALPKIFVTDDLYLNQSKGIQESWQPSAIAQINGQNVIEYLSNFAALNSQGTLEPHADWNTLMDNPVLNVLGQGTTFRGATTFYPGNQFNFTFENGTSITDDWRAIYQQQETGPLETGGDFYNFFVLGFFPASYDPPNSTTTAITTNNSSIPAPTSWNDFNHAFPEHTDVHQANLTTTGFVTGYFYPESSLAVLSIPTFDMIGQAIQDFSDAVQQFIDQAEAQGLQRVVIDLQENGGGDVILAYNTFKQFFPSITPFGGSNRRAVQLANTLGSTTTKFCSNVSSSDAAYGACQSDEWNAFAVIDAATGKRFDSWSQLNGPIFDGVSNVSLTQQLDTLSRDYDSANLGGVVPPPPLFQTNGSNPWAANDIVILSDALCSSTCSLFLEFMRFDAGVKNVVVGGRPTTGPMQTPSLSRGARSYSIFELDTDIDNARFIDSTAILPDRDDQSVFIEWAGVSLRNQIGLNSEVPFQMQYQAADCRIFLNPSTFNNMTNLWKYAADAIWTNSTYCVQGSTGYVPSKTSSSAAPALSIPAGVDYRPNGIISTQNSSASHKIEVTSEPQPDAPTPGGFSRQPHKIVPTVEQPVSFQNSNPFSSSPFSSSFFPSNFFPSDPNQRLEEEEQQRQALNCGLPAAERPSRNCYDRRKRSVVNRRRPVRKRSQRPKGRKLKNLGRQSRATY